MPEIPGDLTRTVNTVVVEMQTVVFCEEKQHCFHWKFL